MLVIKFSFLQPKIPKVWLSIDKKNVVGKCQMSLTFWLIDQSGLIPWQVNLLLFFWSLPHTIASVLSDILSCTCDESLETKKLVKSLLENAKWVWPSDLSTKVVQYLDKWMYYHISDIFLILLQVRYFQLQCFS